MDILHAKKLILKAKITYIIGLTQTDLRARMLDISTFYMRSMQRSRGGYLKDVML